MCGPPRPEVQIGNGSSFFSTAPPAFRCCATAAACPFLHDSQTGEEAPLHAPQGVDGIPLVRGIMPPSLKADCAVRSHTPRNRATAAGPGGRGAFCGTGTSGRVIRKGHMQSHQPSGITSRHSNAGRVQPQQCGVPMHPGPGFPALFQNVHRLHFIIARVRNMGIMPAIPCWARWSAHGTKAPRLLPTHMPP